MELRTLRYFLEIAREENMTKAAERLHVSQSALSRQVKSLEEELGKRLFIRHSFRIELTPEGILLRKRAEDILQMVDKTTEEFQSLDDDLHGDIFIGCAESEAMKRLATLLVDLHRLHPGIHYHLKSGNTADIAGDLDKGLLDFAVIANAVDLSIQFSHGSHPRSLGCCHPQNASFSSKRSYFCHRLARCAPHSLCAKHHR